MSFKYACGFAALLVSATASSMEHVPGHLLQQYYAAAYQGNLQTCKALLHANEALYDVVGRDIESISPNPTDQDAYYAVQAEKAEAAAKAKEATAE